MSRKMSDNDVNIDLKLMTEIENYLKNCDQKDQDLQNSIKVLNEKFGMYGTEKVRIIEDTFDMLLENMLSGCGMKLAFYALDKDKPARKSEFDTYGFMKKLELHEKYPDEKVRNYIDLKRGCNKTEEECENYRINQIEIIKEIYKEVKESVISMIDAKQNLFKVLMKLDVIIKQGSCHISDVNKILLCLNDLKNGDVKVSYKEALNLKFANKELEQTIQIPDPQVMKASMVKIGAMKEEDTMSDEVSQIFKINML
jgi:hypothetical protein